MSFTNKEYNEWLNKNQNKNKSTMIKKDEYGFYEGMTMEQVENQVLLLILNYRYSGVFPNRTINGIRNHPFYYSVINRTSIGTNITKLIYKTTYRGNYFTFENNKLKNNWVINDGIKGFFR